MLSIRAAGRKQETDVFRGSTYEIMLRQSGGVELVTTKAEERDVESARRPSKRLPSEEETDTNHIPSGIVTVAKDSYALLGSELPVDSSAVTFSVNDLSLPSSSALMSIGTSVIPPAIPPTSTHSVATLASLATNGSETAIFHHKPYCEVCGERFLRVGVRHHCRNCGKTVCGQHSTHRATIPAFPQENAKRVCDECFAVLVRDKNTRIAV